MQGDFFLTQWAFLGMRWLYETLTNESIFFTILISTIIIRALSLIGDIKSRKSSMKMQAIQPQINKLQKKYENDPQRMSVEQRKLMKDNNVSMMGGCLPMLITMPIFFIFIAAFRQWGNEMMVRLLITLNDNQQAGVEMFQNFKFLWINNMWQPDSGLKPVIQTAAEFFGSVNKTLPNLLYFKDNPNALQTFLDLGFFVNNNGVYALAPVTDAVTQTYNTLVQPCVDLYAGYNNGWFILPLLAGGTQFLQSWLLQRNQPKNDAAAGSNKLMMYLFPLMSVWFCLSYNASFALYWSVSSIIGIISTFFINKAIAKEFPSDIVAEDKGKIGAVKKEGTKK